MNIISDAAGYLYRGGKKGVGCMYLSVHAAIFYPSNGIKHAVNLLRVMRTSIGTNE